MERGGRTDAQLACPAPTPPPRRPAQVLFGNAFSGEEAVVTAGMASPTKPLTEQSTWRLASMTKIMGAAVAAIAFEEGVASPGDSLAKWVPELAAEEIVGVAVVGAGGQTEVVPLERNITLYDLLGMKAGFT